MGLLPRRHPNDFNKCERLCARVRGDVVQSVRATVSKTVNSSSSLDGPASIMMAHSLVAKRRPDKAMTEIRSLVGQPLSKEDKYPTTIRVGLCHISMLKIGDGMQK